MRTSGVLMPISSLPSQYGIGTMGKEARRFVDFLEKGGQTYWQILPMSFHISFLLEQSEFALNNPLCDVAVKLVY